VVGLPAALLPPLLLVPGPVPAAVVAPGELVVMWARRPREMMERWPQCARAARVPPHPGGCMCRTARVGCMKLWWWLGLGLGLGLG
jgi:hypothetical protein